MKAIWFLLLLLWVPTTGLTQSTLIRSPFEQGNARSPGAFLINSDDAPSARWQQVYAASDFALIGSPMFITEIRFETAFGSPGSVQTRLQNIRIDLSTTPRIPDGLNITFAENIGADARVVFSGPLDFIDYGGFGIHIGLQTPFLYDPSQGNLLMDVRNFRTSYVPVIAYLGAEYAVGDTVSAVTSLSDVNSPTGSLTSLGLETLFEVTPVPEPSTVSLLILGLAALGFVAWKRSGIRRVEHRSTSTQSRQGRTNHVID